VAGAAVAQHQDPAGAGPDLAAHQQGRRGHALYERKRTVAEVQHRIERYWRPYHAALAQAIDDSVARFGPCGI
jgi:N-formylglutamate amidohydrolase